MIRFVKAAVQGVRNEMRHSTPGWWPMRGAAFPSGGVRSAAGKIVTAEDALGISAAWACVRRQSELVGSLPLGMYQRQSDGSRVSLQDDLWQMLAVSPNSDQTAVEFWEGMTAHAVLRGNACAEKVFLGRNPVPVALQPLPNCEPARNSEGALVYRYHDRGRSYELPAAKVFHLRGFGPGDGIGMSAIRFGANSMGAALAADEAAGAVFANGMQLSGVFTIPGGLSPEQRALWQENLNTFSGSKKAGKFLTLEAGFDWKAMQMNPEDSQLLETRRFQVEDVCRWFGVPPVVIGHAGDGQTMWGSGVEAIMLSWLTLGINPLLRKFEARILKDLVPPEQRRRIYAEWNREAMLQMDSRAKGDFLLKMRMGGFMSGDEGRDKLNLQRRGGANDELVVQSSMTLVDLLRKDKE
jgi:HK97 family phage portal protein